MNKKKIAQQAAQVVQEHADKLPVPVIQIAADHGLQVHEVVLTEPINGTIPSGILTYDNQLERWSILVNVSDTPTRKRFTIAHELGHYFLHRQTSQDFVDTFDAGEAFYRIEDPDFKLEKQANYFAACLLMPEDVVRNSWPNCADPLAAAKLFHVSEIAMTYRLKELKLINLM